MINKITFLHFLTASLIIELIMLFLFKFTKYSSDAINNWYNNLEWTAVLLDVLSIMIGFYIARFTYNYLLKNNYINKDDEFIKYLSIVLIVQIIHDFSFYFFIIEPTTPNINKVIDEFKDYAKHYRVQAVVADSLIYLFTTPLLYYYITKNTNNINIFISIVCLYLVGYILHQKALYIN